MGRSSIQTGRWECSTPSGARQNRTTRAAARIAWPYVSTTIGPTFSVRNSTSSAASNGEAVTVHPREFIRTLYLGDRGCKSITIDGYGAAVKVQATCISRVRSSSGNWDYYKDEDIVDGFIVFADVVECELQNGGHVPNDSINDI